MSHTLQMRKSSRLSHLSNMHKLLTQKKRSGMLLDDDSMVSNILRGSESALLLNHSENYKLTRMDLRMSLDSELAQHNISLNLLAEEISLLRYTWGKMLSEGPVEETRSSLPIPGSMGQPREKQQPISRQELGALSTFCTQVYLNLLNMQPHLNRVFPSLRHQAVAMAGVLTFAINLLENLLCLDGYMLELGKRHLRILNIEPAHFELFGEVLIQTFLDRFGSRFNHELQLLWIKFYLYLANSLIHFGFDPVLRLEKLVYDQSTVYSESISSAESVSTTMFEARRGSTTTTATSKMSFLSPSRSESELGKDHISMPFMKQNPAKERRRTRIIGKTDDCVLT